MVAKKPETKMEVSGHHVHSLYIGAFDQQFIDQAYVTSYSLHRDGYSEDFLEDALEQIQYPLFGRWGLIGEKGENDIYAERCSVYIFGQYYGREGLDLKTRGLLVVSCLAALLREGVLPTWVNACRNLGWSENQLKELGAVVSHVAGFPPSRGALMMMDGVFEKRRALTGEKIEPAPPPYAGTDLPARAEEMAVRLFGDPRGDMAALPMPDGDGFAKDVSMWVFGYLFVERNLIPVRAKVLAIIAMCVVKGRMAMARRWMGAARTIGCSRLEVQEALVTTALYGGFPVAQDALAILAEIWPLES